MSVPPQDKRSELRSLINGYRNSVLVYLAARHGIPDLLNNGPRDADDLAAALSCRADVLLRLMRGMASIGLLQEETPGGFSLTEKGALLSGEQGVAFKTEALLAGEDYIPAWANLGETLQTGETAYDAVFGMTPWERREQMPELNTTFNEWLAYVTSRAAPVLAAGFDFSRYETIADIAGGHGALLAEILRAWPAVRGILFEQPHVVDEAESFLGTENVMDRCSIQSGDIFEAIDCKANAFLLKSVIHDWNDEKSIAILANCHAALQPSGTLLLVERFLPSAAKEDPMTVMLDLHMMAVTGGRERTKAEFEDLLERSGFRMTSVTPTRIGFHIMECVPT